MASCSELSYIDFDDDEVFFGPITDTEKKKILMYEGRKTEVYNPSLRSNAIAYDEEKQTFCNFNNDNQTSYYDLQNSNLFSDASEELLFSSAHVGNNKSSEDIINNITNESLKCVSQKCSDKQESNKKLSSVSKIFDTCINNNNNTHNFAEKEIDDILSKKEFNAQETQNAYPPKILHKSSVDPTFNEMDKFVKEVKQNKYETDGCNDLHEEILNIISQKAKSDCCVSVKSKLDDIQTVQSASVEECFKRDRCDNFSAIEKKCRGLISSSEETLNTNDGSLKFLDFCSHKEGQRNKTDARHLDNENNLFLEALDLHDLSLSESNSSILPLRNSLISFDVCLKSEAPSSKCLSPVQKQLKLKENIPENYQTVHFSNVQNISKSQKLQEKREHYLTQTLHWTPQDNESQQAITCTPTKIPVLQNRAKFVAQMHTLEKEALTSKKKPSLINKKKVLNIKREQKDQVVYPMSTQVKNVLTPFRTPLTPVAKSKILKKASQSSSSHKQWKVVSPVAKYIQEQPPPPLIQVVKPKKKIILENLKEANMTNFCYHQAVFQTEAKSDTPALPPARYKTNKQRIKTNECSMTNTNGKIKSKTPTKALINSPSLSLIKHKGASKVVYGTDFLPIEESLYEPSDSESTLNLSHAQHSEKKLLVSKMEMSVLEHVKLFHSNTIE